MEKERQYYEAYDDRYKQVHQKSLQWFSNSPSKIVEETLSKYKITNNSKIIEIGCGEGRDSVHLLRSGYNVLATDISPIVIEYCKEKFSDFSHCFHILDCLSQQLNDKFDFIFAVSVLHMLVLDSDRKSFYQFLYAQLKDDDVALICTMGDGKEEWHSNIKDAFEIQKRNYETTGVEVLIAGTSCRKVNFSTFHKEIDDNELELLESGTTSIIPDFPAIMYAVVKKRNFSL